METNILSRRFCSGCHQKSWEKNIDVKQDTSKAPEYGQFFFYDERFKCNKCEHPDKIHPTPPGYGSSNEAWQYHWNLLKSLN